MHPQISQIYADNGGRGGAVFKWLRHQDSNLEPADSLRVHAHPRRLRQQSLLTADSVLLNEKAPLKGGLRVFLNGSGTRTRTWNLRINSPSRYRLRHAGAFKPCVEAGVGSDIRSAHGPCILRSHPQGFKFFFCPVFEGCYVRRGVVVAKTVVPYSLLLTGWLGLLRGRGVVA
jgi:hypothetical protein